MTYDEVRKMVLAWPGVEDGISYGTPALKIKGKFFTRLKEDGDSLVVKDVDPDERDMLMEAAPDVFYITDHYPMSSTSPIIISVGLWCWCASPRRIPIRCGRFCCAPGRRPRPNSS